MRDGTLNAVWGDTRNGKLNIWFQRMTLNGKTVSVQKLASENTPYAKIFPNPFTNQRVYNILCQGTLGDKKSPYKV